MGEWSLGSKSSARTSVTAIQTFALVCWQTEVLHPSETRSRETGYPVRDTYKGAGRVILRPRTESVMAFPVFRLTLTLPYQKRKGTDNPLIKEYNSKRWITRFSGR